MLKFSLAFLVFFAPQFVFAIHCPNDVSVDVGQILVDTENSPLEDPDEQLVLGNSFPPFQSQAPEKELFAQYLESLEIYAKVQAVKLENTTIDLQVKPEKMGCHYFGTSDNLANNAKVEIRKHEQGDYPLSPGYPRPGQQSFVMEVKIPFYFPTV